MKQLAPFTLALLALMVLNACGSTRSGGDRYAYLRKKGAEPYKVVPLSVLDRPRDESPRANAPDRSGSSLSNNEVNNIIRTARSYEGTPYRYGGTSRNGIDCSGLMVQSFKSIDRQLPRTSSAQSQQGRAVRKNQIAPGDLVFFATRGSRINHVGLVTRVQGREVYFVHATTSRGVREDKLSTDYYARRYKTARRI